MPDSPDFSRDSESYSAYRPRYPDALFAWLASVAPRRDAAWDVATGTGQAALGLAPHFTRVIATDLSAEQIRHATPHPRVQYRVASAESSGLEDAAVDLIASAAAIHWFDLPAFYAEVRRVARPGAVLAAWTYHVGHMEPPFDAVFAPFYEDVLAPYFAPGARLVDDRYRTIDLPGRALDAPEFTMSVRWTAAEVLRYVRTWSGVHAYTDATGEDPVERIAPSIDALCGSTGTRHELRWPLYIRASRLD